MAPGLPRSPLTCTGLGSVVSPVHAGSVWFCHTFQPRSALPVDKTEGKRPTCPKSWFLFPCRGCRGDVLHLMAADAQERTAALSTRGLFPGGAEGLTAVGQKEWFKVN